MGKYENTDPELDEAITTVQRALSGAAMNGKTLAEARDAWLVVLDRLSNGAMGRTHKAALPPKP